ncbi:tetratricopeptide repeat-containing sensor histidine kinase [Pedobacter cryophilus]|uniref:Tetratricopeptide repeat protein n=1 Tax=Pedobacter cryophilus TaxID=2571271 RepID=A0A4U1BZJ9_9SPHI|nr:tetratricopeptide repeat-containing sensor histidine kinase [Pedobacter cryophilus]TKB96936.1 tetratricopeptide repeat protein [Pedobacter cryophilus]
MLINFRLEYLSRYSFLFLLISIISVKTTFAQIEDSAIIKSDSLYRAGEYQKVINLLQNRLVTAQSKKEKVIEIVIYNSFGKAYSQLGKPVEALKNYQIALKKAETDNEKQQSGKILKNIGALYEEQKNFSQALTFYERAQNIAIEIKDESLLADCYNNTGIIYEQQLKYDLALSVYKKALQIYQKLQKTDRIALSLNNIGIVYKYLGELPKAIEYYNQSLIYSEKLGDKFFVAANLNNIGNVYALLKNYPKAIEFNTKSLKIAESIQATNIVVEAYGSLAEDYEGLGDYKKALYFKNKYTKVNSDYINVESAKQLAEMQTLYQTEKQRGQITALKQNEQINSLKMARQELLIQKRNYQILFTVLVMMIFISSGYLYFQKQRVKQKREQRRAILLAETNERSRIAKDVHDDIGSGLSKITLMAGMVSHKMQANGVEVGEINNITQISKDLVENMRDLIWVLNPQNATLDNLVARIREYCSDYLEGLSVKSDLAIQDEIPQIKISQEVQRNIFLTIKEALHNCIKHADCHQIFIELVYKNDLLTFHIKDSGKGFEMNELKKSGNGLKNMQQRMQTIGATFKVNSVLGEGTSVKTEIKLAQLEKAVA